MTRPGEPRRPLVLVVDDEEAIRTLLLRYLQVEGYDVCVASNGASALAMVAEHRPDLVVLDRMMPFEDGLDVLVRLRDEGDMPVILLTALGNEEERVLGLKLGADDYVVKPFSLAEIAARISTVLRREAQGAAPTRHEFDGLAIDVGAREVTVGGDAVETTAKEFDVLVLLATSPRQVFSREEILDQVRGSSSEWQDPATVTEHIRRIRKRIETDPDDPRWIRTVRGAGYRFEP